MTRQLIVAVFGSVDTARRAASDFEALSDKHEGFHIENGVVVLPAPYDKYTNTCSSDTDCAGVSIQYNVGKLLREQTGIDSIKDANVEYGMNVCADVKISEKISCGICVPCAVDADCGTGACVEGACYDDYGTCGWAVP